MSLQKRSCPYKLWFDTYPRGPPFFGSYRGHYPIVEFEIWPFHPRVKLSLSTMCPLIDIFSRCSCNVVRLLHSCSLSYALSLSLSLSLSSSALYRLPSSLPRYPLTSFFFPLRTSQRSAAVLYKVEPECFYSRGLTHSPSTWFILNPCSLSPSGPDLKLVSAVEKKWSYETGERSVVLWSLPCVKFYLRWRSLLYRV